LAQGFPHEFRTRSVLVLANAVERVNHWRRQRYRQCLGGSLGRQVDYAVARVMAA
jgi:hypothetical protein